MNPDTIEPREPPYRDQQAVPNSGLPQMLGIGLVFAVVVAGLAFWNATVDHGPPAANTPAPQHANAPPSTAPVPPTKTQ